MPFTPAPHIDDVAASVTLKYEHLANKRRNAIEQQRDPNDIPLNVQDGYEILRLLDSVVKVIANRG